MSQVLLHKCCNVFRGLAAVQDRIPKRCSSQFSSQRISSCCLWRKKMGTECCWTHSTARQHVVCRRGDDNENNNNAADSMADGIPGCRGRSAKAKNCSESWKTKVTFSVKCLSMNTFNRNGNDETSLLQRTISNLKICLDDKSLRQEHGISIE